MTPFFAKKSALPIVVRTGIRAGLREEAEKR